MSRCMQLMHRIVDKIHIEKRQRTVVKTKKARRLNRYDIIAIISITLIYALIAFFDLGGRDVPTTYLALTDQQKSVIIDTGKSTKLGTICAYLGDSHPMQFTIEQSDEIDGKYEFVSWESVKGIFRWEEFELDRCTKQYYKITTASSLISFGEFVLFDDEGNYIKPIVSNDNAKLFDEQDTYGDGYSKKNSTYFDEVYYARTVYDMEHGLPWYEATHPPLGKIIMDLGVKMFGLNPFGWRFMGTFLGVLMVPLFYVMVNRLFRKQFLNIILTIIFSFDFMHFVQTRLATIDVFVTFFIMAMYYFMIVYCDQSFYDQKLTKTLIPLTLSGICMGFAIASKWTGVYAAVGLAVLFFRQMWIRFRERDLVEDAQFMKKMFATCGACILFFILIPAAIYIASYIPFKDNTTDGLFLRMLHNQEWMFSYHSKLKATHPFSSKWYEWPIMARPMFYYVRTVKEGVKEGISAFGNPLVWWVGIPAAIMTCWYSIKKKDGIGATIIIGYLAQFLPWVLITRCTFIYHYFPSVPFVVLMIGYCMKQALEKKERISKKIIIVYTIAVVVMFGLFYPVLAGRAVSYDYVQYVLRWFDSWVLI